MPKSMAKHKIQDSPRHCLPGYIFGHYSWIVDHCDEGVWLLQ